MSRLLFAGLAAAVLSAACAKSATPAAEGIVVKTTPPAAALVPGDTQGFSAVVFGTTSTSVTWSVQEGAPGGAVTDGGIYTAPETPGTFHVVATSVADSSKSGSSAVTVLGGVAVSTGTPSIDVCGTATFTAVVAQGAGNQAVNWSVLEAGGGTITSAGVYTAPSTPGTYHIVATSQADPAQSGQAPEAVAQHILSVQVTPATTTVTTGTNATFTAKVTNTCGTFTASKIVRAADLARR